MSAIVAPKTTSTSDTHPTQAGSSPLAICTTIAVIVPSITAATSLFIGYASLVTRR